jgi:hypothetical protein
MASTRSGKRSANGDSDEGRRGKRRHRPNQNTLDIFSANQSPLRRSKGRKKPVRRSSPPPAALPKTGSKRAPVEVSSEPANSSPASITGTPLSSRTRLIRPPFDPKEDQTRAHYVTLTITPVINGSRKLSLLKSININDVFRPDFEAIQDHIWEKRVRQWDENRGRRELNAARARYWTVIIGNPRGTHSIIQVEDEEEWKEVQARLRQLQHAGEKKLPNEMLIDAIYTTVDRENSLNPASQKDNKGRPETSRRTRLITSSEEEDADEEVDDSEPVLLEGRKSQKKPRDSITNRQLQQKKDREQRSDSLENTRQQIFSRHICNEDRCPNRSGCCYKTKEGSHHKISPVEQEEWAQCVIAGAQDATVQLPPRYWLARYTTEGYNEMKFKRTGSRKQDMSTASTTPTESTLSKAVEVHNHFAAPTTAHPPPQASIFGPPPSYFGTPYEGYNYASSLPQQPSQRQHIKRHQSNALTSKPVPSPSSPIRPTTDPDNSMTQFVEWLSENELMPDRRRAFKITLQVIQKQMLDLEQLKQPEGRDILEKGGVPAGVALLFSKQVSEFKKIYKAQQEVDSAAAKALTEVRTGRPLEQYSGFSSASELRQLGGSRWDEGTSELQWEPELDYFDEE